MVRTLNKAVYMDFDGTLSDDDISIEFMNFLFENKLYSEDCYSEQSRLIEQFENGRIDYVNWNKFWAFYWGNGLKGQREDVINSAAVDFYPLFRKNVYPSSFELVKEFGDKNFHRVIVSVSAYEVIRVACEDLKADDSIATECEIIDGVYTGKVLTDFHLPEGKEIAIREYIKGTNLFLDQSVAIGNAKMDGGMLSMVGTAIASNPSEELRLLAQQRGWHIRDHTNILDLVKTFSKN